MTRSAFRNFWIFCLSALLIAAFVLFQKGQKENDMIFRKNSVMARLKQEKHDARQVFVALEELDSRTVDEATATRLSLLRHLGIEKDGYTFSVLSKQRQDMRGSVLFLRNVSIEADVPYKEAMALLDRLYDTNKISLEKFELKKSQDFGDRVRVIAQGTMYGLDKLNRNE